VLAPTGQLLYLIDAADSNKVYSYHFDRNGNTLFLTDAAGMVTDSYACTPYGKLLHHEGANDQPFTFGGELGVRQEGSNGGLYQMRMRYYNPTSGRFLSREPIWPIIGDSSQINPYQYAADNPMLNIDPTGAVPVPAKKGAKKIVKKIVKKIAGEVGEEVAEIVLDVPISPLGILLHATPLGGKKTNGRYLDELTEEEEEANKEHTLQRLSSSLAALEQEEKRIERLKSRGHVDQEYIEKMEERLNKARELRRERTDREIGEIEQRLALRKGEEAYYKWMNNKRESIKKVKGLWVHAGKKWLFFPRGNVMYRDYPGSHGNRAMIAVKITDACSETGIWVHDVSEVEQGHGPSWW
jgi:RHS repeat-associated protein